MMNYDYKFIYLFASSLAAELGTKSHVKYVRRVNIITTEQQIASQHTQHTQNEPPIRT